MRQGMTRLQQSVLIVSFVGFCWLAMQAVHELGHVLGATMTGGSVTKVVLHPCTFSRTDIAPNPHPLTTVWMGPLIGALLPALACLFACLLRAPGIYLFRFFAGFCLIANGVYIAAGSYQNLADAGDMIRYGSSQWQLLAFGVIAVPAGLFLWNGLGPKFGLGETKGIVSRPAMFASTALFVMLVVVETVIGSR